MTRILAAALIMAGCAGSSPAQAQSGPSPVGRTFHYERTNIAGGEEEQVYLHRAAPDRVEVYKMVERCTKSAFVTAYIDPQTGVATRLVAARLTPDGPPAQYATLETGALSGGGTAIRIDVQTDGGPLSAAIGLPAGPWHDYDYDLGTLAASLQARPGSRADYSFQMTMVGQIPEAPDAFFHPLGTATLRFAAAEKHMGVDTLRFDASGPAFGSFGGGPLWVDAKDGHIIDVQWGRPNHSGYKDFRLRLIAEEPAGEAAWAALLKRHYEGCPASTSAQ
jgi:hypothetical protein